MNTLLVTGASGQLGRRVIHHLLKTLKVEPALLIASTRQPEALSDLTALGINVRKADFDDEVSLPSAFDGAERALLISTDPIDRPGRRLEQHQRALTAVARAGVKHLIYTSCPQPEHSPLLIAADHAGTEKLIRDSYIPGWTILRNHWYFENLIHTLAGVKQRGGKWYSAAGDGLIASLSRDDLALAAATALASPWDGRRTLTLSGTEALSTVEQAQVLASILGRPIDVVPVPSEVLVRGMVSGGIPESIARTLASFDTNTAAGRVAEVTSDFFHLTGRIPLAFADWIHAHRDILWS